LSNPSKETGSNSRSFQIKPPSISLPKGGGAIRGIGEKFTANPVTGTGSMSAPIFTSPGRSGFGPQLSLTYNSGTGNGPFGYGWSLSLPSITRKTERGLPKYQDADESDVFILSDNEDLVPVLVNQNGQWNRKKFNLTLPDGKTFSVQRYRPRIEGLFARIERWTNIQNGNVHWRSISRNNITTLFGKTDNARISDPKDKSCIFKWLISESYDDRGNAITYEYKEENSEGVDTCYLKRIHYGNRVPRQPDEDLTLRTDWLFEVVFDYSEHDLDFPNPQEIQSWVCRQDAFSVFRSCFEVRTYRLCRRVLMFHHFPDEFGINDYLVKSTDFAYDESPIASFIVGITHSGYVKKPDGKYLKKSMPPLEFEYSKAIIHETISEIDAESLENLPIGLDGTFYQWIDLDGEGLSGILTEQAENWYYKKNLGNGRLGHLKLVAAKPSIAALSNGRQQLMDLAGNGQLDLIELSNSISGFYERTQDQKWNNFTLFTSIPNINWNDPNLKLLDLTGDGHSDILIMKDEVIRWHPSLAKQGFGPFIDVYKPYDEEKGPKIVFADGTQSIYLSDMNGDGLIDLVRIRNDGVCFWPNQGYGYFGKKVTMNNSPRFDVSEQFNQNLIRLADIDGSGLIDILYLGRDGVYIFFNQSGNSWSNGRKLRQFPNIDNLKKIMIVDLFGTGTACVVWSSPLSIDTQKQLWYIDLMGGQKPHLLVGIKNNMGAETHIQYTPSTQFYLSDLEAGKPWITRIPFPVYVVERIEVYDRISRNRFVTHFAYHHFYYDGTEREFHGIGLVEQWDTEEFAILNASSTFPKGDNINAASHTPPVLTKTWFHTGAFIDRNHVSRQYEDEYFKEPSLTDSQHQALLLPDTIFPPNLSVQEAREACRALKGSILRQEIYSFDDTDKEYLPYSVSEHNYTIQLIQQQKSNKHAVFFTHPREIIDFNYERMLFEVFGCKRADPRVIHSMNLEVDNFGNVLKSVVIGYGRRYDDLNHLLTYDNQNQKNMLTTFTVNRYTNPINLTDDYRTPLLYETCSYELLKVIPTSIDPLITNLFRFDEMIKNIEDASDGTHDISYEDVDATAAVLNTPYRRLIENKRVFYRKNDLTGYLPLGKLESLALPYESYLLSLTPNLINQVYDGRVTDIILTNDGKYIHNEGDENWWIPSGQIFYSNINDSPAQELAFASLHFFNPYYFKDPFGQITTINYDNYDLLIEQTTDPLFNIISAKNDYRVLQPKIITDPNGNRTEISFDVLGFIVGTSVMGKVDENKGDSLIDFEPDLSENIILTHITYPLTNPNEILQRATTRIIYDLHSYYRTRNNPYPNPIVVYTLTRETHDVDQVPDQLTKIQHSFLYSDGFGREIQKKLPVESGDVEGTTADPRWIGSGWTIFNNKNKPVKRYEPFFSLTHKFEFKKIVGVSSTLIYDPLERVVATLYSNHTYEKVVINPWYQETWDENDTVLEINPLNDPDICNYFLRLQNVDYLPTWYVIRKDGQLGPIEQSSAQKAAEHAFTPTITLFDVLGRTYLTVSDNGKEGKYTTYMELDIENNQRKVIDYKGRIVMQFSYDMLGNLIEQKSMDAGNRWILNDIALKPIYNWDSRDNKVRHVYDSLQRPTHLFVQKGNNLKKLIERTVYGEAHPDSKTLTTSEPPPRKLNLRGQIYMRLDRSGVTVNYGHNPQTDEYEAYDFKGNLLHTRRQLNLEYKQPFDWSNIEHLLNTNLLKPSDIETALVPFVEKDTYITRTTYDALNRSIIAVMPDKSIIHTTYNESNLLDYMEVYLHGTDTATIFIKNIDYNEKGRRKLIEYGNGLQTTFDYDKNTFRLIHLCTRRGTKHLQDLFYTYDPVGNIIAIRDDAQQIIYFNGTVVNPNADYTYDAIYRLIEAEGREHIGQASQPHTTWQDKYRINFAHPNDGQKIRKYVESYKYDSVGNISSFKHKANNGYWIRNYYYEEKSLIEHDKKSNRLSRTVVHPNSPHPIFEPYTYDVHGNICSMPHLHRMEWDFEDQLQMVDKGGGCRVYYVYDMLNQRVRKVREQNGRLIDQRIYINGYEIYRKYNAEVLKLERETLHLMDDEKRVALVDTKTFDLNESNNTLPEVLIRYQLSNHLNSAILELDDNGKVISYEEYHPYGSSAYQSVRKSIEVPLKRYRYVGKERDEESGLYYLEARFYIPWLGRWMSCDPAGIKDGLNRYQYSQCNPIMFYDPSGTQSIFAETSSPSMKNESILVKEVTNAQSKAHNHLNFITNVAEQIKHADEYVTEFKNAKNLIKRHRQLRKLVKSMGNKVKSLQRSYEKSGRTSAALKELKRTQKVKSIVENAYKASKGLRNAANEFIKAYETAIKSDTINKMKSIVGGGANKIKQVLRSSKIGRSLIRTGKVLGSSHMSKSILALGALIEAGNAFVDSPARTKTGKTFTAVLSAGASVLLSTAGGGLVDIADWFLPEKFKVSKVLRGTAHEGVVIFEGFITGDESGMRDFHISAKSGRYGIFMEFGVEVGEAFENKFELGKWVAESGYSGIYKEVWSQIKLVRYLF
jgi:RHS repeat-associated protein